MDMVTTATQSSSTVDATELLGVTEKQTWWRSGTLWIVVALAAIVGTGVYVWLAHRQASATQHFVTEAIGRGSIVLTVTANGTLKPTRSVDIGSELSGTVARVLVDVNDRVKQGQVLVELDTAKLQDQVKQARATLAADVAKVAQMRATVKEAQTNLARLQKVAQLSDGNVPSKSELDSAQATLDRALADEASANAAVANAKAALSTDETNLKKASIRSSIDGVVLTRSVEPGNAVAASLQAVTLLTIAENLRQLQLQVNVDEADVGSVAVGQQTMFTVSAYPGRKFPATITRVSYGSTTTENVVTYITYLDVDNADLSLRPGMTATATITAAERRDALLVPNTALRFTPLSVASSTASSSTQSGGLVSSLIPRMSSQTTRKSTGNATTDERQVWVLKNGAATPTTVKLGISDGRMTEVIGGGLQAGMQVITDQVASATQ